MAFVYICPSVTSVFGFGSWLLGRVREKDGPDQKERTWGRGVAVGESQREWGKTGKVLASYEKMRTAGFLKNKAALPVQKRSH